MVSRARVEDGGGDAQAAAVAAKPASSLLAATWPAIALSWVVIAGGVT